MATISQADRIRLQAHLRKALRSPSITLDPPETLGGTVQVRTGENVLGTVDQVDDEGERSWAVTLVVLAEDLEP